MKTTIYKPQSIDEVAQYLREGDLIAFPTETVYGLGACAENESAVSKVYQAKGRPSDNPLIVHVSCIDEVLNYVTELPENAQLLMETYWPGPLTIVLPIQSGALSNTVTGGLPTCAFRMPDFDLTRRLIQKTGPLVGPSANTSGKPSPTKAIHVYNDLSGKIKGVLDGGTTKVGVESTVIEITQNEVVILRPGAITKSMIEKIVDIPVVYDKHLIQENEIPKSPGMKYKHYAPNIPVIIVYPEDFEQAILDYKDEKIAIMASEDIIHQLDLKNNIITYPLSRHHDSKEAAMNLFDGLRSLDNDDNSLILAEGYKDNQGLSTAYMNRLKKAAAQHVYSDKKID